ncbi:MAG: type II toxin-antitoxin system RelB/DinJ family antitoxin [Tissierellia bacterium]|nr:type II toxin-antitoxin system RelB/DinJ family antitoxin [Tissierellia bacterium]
MAQINVRIDEDVKRDAEETLNEIGLSMSAAITIFLKKVVRENRIPFELSIDPFYSEENMKRLKKAKEDANCVSASLKAHELIEFDGKDK